MSRKQTLGLICILMLFSASLVFAEDFEAKVSNSAADGYYQGKVFVSGDKVRLESQYIIKIVRKDKNVIWFLYSDTKKYQEALFEPLYIIANLKNIPGQTSRLFIGKGLFHGEMVDKYQVMYKQDGIEGAVVQWLRGDTAVPLRTASLYGIWNIEYYDIKLEAQPQELFEIPEGFEKDIGAPPKVKKSVGGVTTARIVSVSTTEEVLKDSKTADLSIADELLYKKDDIKVGVVRTDVLVNRINGSVEYVWSPPYGHYVKPEFVMPKVQDLYNKTHEEQ